MPRFIEKDRYFQQLESNFEQLFTDLFSLSVTEKMLHFNVGERGLCGYFPFFYEVTDQNFGAENKEYWHICRMVDISSQDLNFYPKNPWPVSLGKHFELLQQLYLHLDTIADKLLLSYSSEFAIPIEYQQLS